MESAASVLLMLFLHILSDIGELSLHSFVFIALQEGKRSIEYSVCCFLLVELAIHVAFDITLLAIGKTTVAGLNIVNNSLNSTS